jgi:hypothetical protein
MSGIGSTAAAEDLPASLSAEPLALVLLLVRVRVVRSRDISVFSLRRAPYGRRALQSVRGRSPHA